VPASPADALTTIPPVRVAVIDVGSNSVRVLIATVQRGEVRKLERDRVYLKLGDDAYTLGRIGARKLSELEAIAERYAQLARRAQAERIETIVTAPGRQSSNVDEIVDVLEEATRAPVAVLTAEDEGRLAWSGAVSSLQDPPDSVAVVDLGGGSCEVAVGRSHSGPDWICSRDAGALRVTRALLPAVEPTEPDLARARSGVHDLLDGISPPRADAALAVGGTARAVGRVIGPRYGAGKLDALAERLVREGTATVTAGHDITPGRVETLLGGTVVLSEIARRLDAKLEVTSGGLREGAALALAHAASAAA
jgi:exopolyphosphatase / guanosine-5'-triphosphate,3'-diphosphate pyrophosphatase